MKIKQYYIIVKMEYHYRIQKSFLVKEVLKTFILNLQEDQQFELEKLNNTIKQNYHKEFIQKIGEIDFSLKENVDKGFKIGYQVLGIDYLGKYNNEKI